MLFAGMWTGLKSGVNLLGKGVNLLGQGVNLLGKGVDLLGKVMPFGGLFGSDGEDFLEKQPLIWIEEILEKDEIDLLGNCQYDLVTILLDLTLYHNPHLVNISFQLLNDLFSQRIHMIELLREM
jgi:hypothetical protein